MSEVYLYLLPIEGTKFRTINILSSDRLYLTGLLSTLNAYGDNPVSIYCIHNPLKSC
jgi:hypothetical protein